MKHRIHRQATLWALCTIALTLTACGGGGDSTTTIKTVDVAAYMHNRLAGSGQWVMQGTGTVNGTSVPITITLGLAPGSTQAFPLNNKSGSTSVQTTTVSGTGASGTTTVTQYFDSADHLFGATDNSGGCQSIIASATPLPTAADIGNTGALYTAQSFTGCSTPIPIGTSTVTWSVENDGGVILVCENSALTIGSAGFSGSTCHESDANGVLGGRARVTITNSAVSITTRNY